MTAIKSNASAIETVRTLERRRIAATGANDVEALAPLLHDDLIYINSVGDTFGKAEYLHALDSGSLAYDKDFDVHETDFRAFEDVVILVGVMLGHSRLDGEQQVFHFRCISVWRQQAGDWRMVAWQSSSSSFAGTQMLPMSGTRADQREHNHASSQKAV